MEYNKKLNTNPTPIETPTKLINGILHDKYLNPSNTNGETRINKERRE